MHSKHTHICVLVPWTPFNPCKIFAVICSKRTLIGEFKCKQVVPAECVICQNNIVIQIMHINYCINILLIKYAVCSFWCWIQVVAIESDWAVWQVDLCIYHREIKSKSSYVAFELVTSVVQTVDFEFNEVVRRHIFNCVNEIVSLSMLFVLVNKYIV